MPGTAEPRYRAFTSRDLDELTGRAGFGPAERLQLRAVAEILPFRTNSYVVDELIDWAAAPDDPLYRMTFPQLDMVSDVDRERIADLLRCGAPAREVRAAAGEVRRQLNPDVGAQRTLNLPILGEDALEGMQHKYRETLLVFPKQGQTCHAYCSYCFRWTQFVGENDWKMATGSPEALRAYLLAHPEVTDVLFTGGDPLIMATDVLARYVDVLLDPRLDHVSSIRIGTKALSFWPYRLLDGADADALLELFDRVAAAGRNLALMAHFSHPRELTTEQALRAMRRLRGTGVVIRCQAPLIAGVNDDPTVWATMWRAQVRLGAVPYYMFVERDTGPQDYFAVPLVRGAEIFGDAYREVSGLGRTVRGPVMSAIPGKVSVDGIAEIAGERVIVLHMIQARDARLVNKPFFARYDPAARWLTDLEPAFADRFPFDPGPSSPSQAREPLCAVSTD